MLNPASRSRKPKPVAMFCRLRFCSVLCTRKAPSATTAATNTTWMATPRTTGSCHGGGRLGRDTSLVAPSATVVTPPLLKGERGSADRHRVHQPAARPQIVEAAIELQRRILADVAVEDLAVIADRL